MKRKVAMGCAVVLIIGFLLAGVGVGVFAAAKLVSEYSDEGGLSLPFVGKAASTPAAAHSTAMTPAPAFPSATPASAAAAEVIFSDDFSDPSATGWKSGRLAHGEILAVDGAYQITVTSPKYTVWATHPVDADDVVVRVDAQIVQSTGDGGFGVLCRGDLNENFYAFEVAEDGTYRIWKFVDGTIEPIVPWTGMTGAYGLFDSSSPYRITAVCSGNTIGLAINDTWLDVLQDESFSGSGTVGLLAGGGRSGGFAVRFDNLVVTAPPADGALPPLPQSAPRPLFTPQSQPSPALQPTVQGTQPLPRGEVLFSDDFSDSTSGWDVYRDEDAAANYYPDGTYHIRVMSDLMDAWANPGRKFPADVIVEVDATKVGGTDDNDFGLICRYQDSENFYYFFVSSDGYYAISEMRGGERILLNDKGSMLYSEEIPRGGATVHLQAACIGNTLSLWVNGKLFTQVQNDDIAQGGDVGLIAGTYDTPDTEISFDDFVVYAPER